MKKLTLSILMLGILLLVVGNVSANTIESSTMIFEGELTPSGDGYIGVVAMVSGEGYDIYGKEGATAWFGDGAPPGTVWTPEVMSNHDGWPGYTRDTPDWYQYSLELDGNSWAVRNHPGATPENPWSSAPEIYPAKGVPMSGNMNLVNMYASEDDVGAYISGTGIPEIPDGAATKGGGAQAWDMDWSWGSEVVPLEHGGFLVEIIDLGEGNYEVSFIPSTIYTPRKGDYVKEEVNIAWDGTFESASLAYRKGTCGLGTTEILNPRVSSKGSYSWDISDLDDGEYCIKLVDGNLVYDEVEVIKDTTLPEVVFDEEFWFTEVNQSIEITGSITDEGEIVSIFVNYGDETNGSVNNHFPSPQPFSASHKYVQEGKYTVTVTATDEANNVGSNSVSVIVSMEEPDWVIPLYADRMNLISIPLVPENTNYKVVLDGIKDNLDRVWAYVYNEETKKNEWKYRYVSENNWYGSTGFNNIVPGYGYIVFMKNDDVLYGKAKTVSQDSSSQPVIPSSVKLANGYNLIGHYGKIELSIDKALSTLRTEVMNYYDSVRSVTWNSVAIMKLGEGYWVYMKELPGTWTENYYGYAPSNYTEF